MGRARASGSLLLLVCTSTLALLLGQGWSAAVEAGTIAQSGTVEAQCGRELGGVQCNGGLCCSQYGFCGSTAEYCGRGCQSGCDGPLQPCREQAGGRNVCPLGLCCSPAGFCERRCPPPSPAVPAPAGGGLAGIVSAGLFDSLFPRRDGLYSYTALLQAAASFPGFATSGGEVARRREVAAFFAHVTEETSGLFYTREISRGRYCNGDAAYPCYADKDYYGRGPLQLKWNYNYGRAGSFLGLGLAREPDLLATNSLFSFQASIWFWMTPLDGRPSCREVITGAWVPGERDRAAGREPGFGLTTNILHGGTSCGTSSVTRNDAARAASYQRIANVLSVDPGAYRNCHLMQAYPEP